MIQPLLAKIPTSLDSSLVTNKGTSLESFKTRLFSFGVRGLSLAEMRTILDSMGATYLTAQVETLDRENN